MDMRHHGLRLGAVEHLRERVHDLVLAERTAVELVDALIDHHSGLLLHKLRELTAVVLLDGHDALRRTEDRADRLRREWTHEPALQEVDLLPLRLEGLERVEDRALRRAPGEDGEVGVLRPVQEVLLFLRHRLLEQLQLVHALVHHGDAHLDALGDVTIGVVLVAGDPVAPTSDARTRSRGDPILRERVAEIFLHVREIHLPVAIPVVAGLATRVVWPLRVNRRPLGAGEDLTAVNIWPAEFELVDRRVDRRELLVGQHDDRHLVPLGPVEGGERVLVALTQVAGRDDHVRELACAGCSANWRSPCSCRVGMPVEGPPRWYMTSTGPGHSVIDAKPIPSTMRAKPGPLVAVDARTPMCAAPTAMLIEAISSSHWTTSRLYSRCCRSR